MRIGYPCKNLALGEAGNAKTFRLASYSADRLRQTVAHNLLNVLSMLAFNGAHGLRHFRLSSDLVPFASHPVCDLDWVGEFAATFSEIGAFARAHGMRLSAHPGQFVLLNSPKEEVVQASIAELDYHARMMDAIGAGPEAKLQIHVGGLYGDRQTALDRFVERYERLPDSIRDRLAIENDERQFGLADCLELHQRTGVPVIFDTFHHSILNAGEPLADAMRLAAGTWSPHDGPLMVDYSSQDLTKQVGAHCVTVDPADLRSTLEATRQTDFDLMLEIKDKEHSALIALEIARDLGRIPSVG